MKKKWKKCKIICIYWHQKGKQTLDHTWASKSPILGFGGVGGWGVGNTVHKGPPPYAHVCLRRMIFLLYQEKKLKIGPNSHLACSCPARTPWPLLSPHAPPPQRGRRRRRAPRRGRSGGKKKGPLKEEKRVFFGKEGGGKIKKKSSNL